MAKGALMVWSNPTSPEQDSEFNRWYTDVHIRELGSAPGLTKVTRYRVSDIQIPDTEAQAHGYLAIYEMDDVASGLASLGQVTATPSDAIDMANTKRLLIEEIAVFEK